MQGDSRHVLFDFMDYLYEKIGAKVPLFCNICKFLRDFFIFFSLKRRNFELLGTIVFTFQRFIPTLFIPACPDLPGTSRG